MRPAHSWGPVWGLLTEAGVKAPLLKELYFLGVYRSGARRLWRSLVALAFPPVCGNCRQVGALLCANCRAEVVWLREPLCKVCGRTVSRPGLLCTTCRQQRPPLQRIRAAVLFDGPVPRMIHQMKYNGAFGLAEPLAELMVEAWPTWQEPVDLVLPVPLHPERERKRGYNQAMLLVRHLCAQLGYGTTPAGVRRTKDTRPQVGLNQTERLQNVSGAFFADPALVAGQRILLVDDVCTTGATMIATAEALLAAGAGSVTGYCLARAM